MLSGHKPLPNRVLAESEDIELMNSLTSSFRQTKKITTQMEAARKIRRKIFVKHYKSRVKFERKKNKTSEKTPQPFSISTY